MLRYLVFFVLIIFGVLNGAAQGSIVLTDDNLNNSFADKVFVLEDAEKKIRLDEFIDWPESEFIQFEEPIGDFNFTASRFWVKFSVTNLSSKNTFILNCARAITNKVELFEIDSSGNVLQHYISGDDYDYDQKKIPHRKNLFPLEIDSSLTKNYVLLLESDGELLLFPMRIHDTASFHAQDFKVQFANGFYYGLIALVVIIYFFFFYFLRDKTFLYYIFYVFSQGVLQFSLDGYSHHHFFPSGGYFGNHVLLFFAGLTVIFSLIYVNHFLDLRKNSIKLRKVFIVLIIIISVVMILSLIPGKSYQIAYPLINGVSLIGVLLAAYSILHLRLMKVKVDVFFAIAFIVLIIGGVVFILGNVGVLGDKEISLNALKISSALEFVILSISMSNKYGSLQREKNEAQAIALKNLQEKNQLMDRSNLILEQQVTERTREIERQKEELALSNEEILDSIKYAKRIQEAILPTAKQVSSFLPDSFVLYRPKDVVSGDFYFIERATTTNENKSDYVIFSAIDCTGHGVPGAFMSIVGNNLLAQTLNDSTINNPSDALNFLNEGVYKTLRQSNADSQVRDGMDLAFCALNAEKGELMFSGAKNPVYIIRSKNLEPLLLNGEILTPKVESDIFCLYEVKGDKQPVGNNSGYINAKFTNHIIKVIPNDMVYVFTDGYADQFGGPKNKKYNYTRFRQFLLSIASFSSKKQGELLERELIEWQGDFFQVDDILVLGVRV